MHVPTISQLTEVVHVLSAIFIFHYITCGAILYQSCHIDYYCKSHLFMFFMPSIFGILIYFIELMVEMREKIDSKLHWIGFVLFGTIAPVVMPVYWTVSESDPTLTRISLVMYTIQFISRSILFYYTYHDSMENEIAFSYILFVIFFMIILIPDLIIHTYNKIVFCFQFIIFCQILCYILLFILGSYYDSFYILCISMVLCFISVAVIYPLMKIVLHMNEKTVYEYYNFVLEEHIEHIMINKCYCILQDQSKDEHKNLLNMMKFINMNKQLKLMYLRENDQRINIGINWGNISIILSYIILVCPILWLVMYPEYQSNLVRYNMVLFHFCYNGSIITWFCIEYKEYMPTNLHRIVANLMYNKFQKQLLSETLTTDILFNDVYYKFICTESIVMYLDQNISLIILLYVFPYQKEFEINPSDCAYQIKNGA
eukprot:281959_1